MIYLVSFCVAFTLLSLMLFPVVTIMELFIVIGMSLISTSISFLVNIYYNKKDKENKDRFI